MPDVPTSGRDGLWVYYMRGGKQCRRRYVVPRDPRTPAQLRQRAALSAASKAWSQSERLTQEQRREWRAAGAKVQSRPRLGQSGPLTGQLHFVGRNCTLNQMGREMLWGPTQREGDGQIRSPKVGIRRKSVHPPQCPPSAGLRRTGCYGGLEIRNANGAGRRCGRRGMVLGLNELHRLNGLHGLQRDVAVGRDLRRMHRRSTWEQYRDFAVAARWECRRGEEHPRRVWEVRPLWRLCAVAESRHGGYWRELWRGS
jgi:hypothetical protein